ncbi:MAG: hypothetical protein U0522_01175 [Candidatus Paceibacterota bacterium]
MKNSPLEWEALEHHHEEKSNDWFWAVGIIAISIALASIIWGNLLFGILILIATFSLVLHAVRQPKIHKVKIDSRGVTIDNFHYPYKSLDSFWINENENPPVLLLKSQRFFLPLLVIRLDTVHPEDIREYLQEVLYEDEMHEPFFQKLAEYFGF